MILLHHMMSAGAAVFRGLSWARISKTAHFHGLHFGGDGQKAGLSWTTREPGSFYSAPVVLGSLPPQVVFSTWFLYQGRQASYIVAQGSQKNMKEVTRPP